MSLINMLKLVYPIYLGSNRQSYEVMEKVRDKKISWCTPSSWGVSLYLSFSYYWLPATCHFCGLGTRPPSLVHSGILPTFWSRKWGFWYIQTLSRTLQKPLVRIHCVFSGILSWALELIILRFYFLNFFILLCFMKSQVNVNIL